MGFSGLADGAAALAFCDSLGIAVAGEGIFGTAGFEAELLPGVLEVASEPGRFFRTSYAVFLFSVSSRTRVNYHNSGGVLSFQLSEQPS